MNEGERAALCVSVFIVQRSSLPSYDPAELWPGPLAGARRR